MSDDAKPAAPNMRTFGLNSPEFYEAVCRPNERRARPPADDGVWVDAETDDAAIEAFDEWRRRVAGRMGVSSVV